MNSRPLEGFNTQTSTAMPFYRFVTGRELDLIKRNKALLPSGHYPPYQSNEVVCLFESEDLPALFKRYGAALAELRSLTAGEKLIVLEADHSIGLLEEDRSQSGWNESRVLRRAIAAEKLTIVAEAVVSSGSAGGVTLGALTTLPHSSLTS
jgi:hypothetical protein